MSEKKNLEEFKQIVKNCGYLMEIRQNDMGETKSISLKKGDIKYVFQISGDGEITVDALKKVIVKTYREVREKVCDDMIHQTIAKTLEGDDGRISMEELFMMIEEKDDALKDLKDLVDGLERSC